MNNSKLHLLVVNYEYPPIGGGGGVICKDIAEEIVKIGHRVTVVTSQYQGLPKEEIVSGVRVIRVPVLMRNKQNTASLPSMLSYVPFCIKAAKTIYCQDKFDIINTHFAIPSGPAGQYLARKFKIPNVLSIHGGDIFDPSKSLSPHKTFGLKQTVRRMINKANRVVAQSSDTQKNARKYYQVERDIDIIPLGIKPNPFQQATREELNLPSEGFIFSTIGRLVRRKNLVELLEILAELKKEFRFRMLIMGDGPEGEMLKSKIDELQLQQSVMLLGRVSEEQKYKYLSVSDAYLSTAMHEGFGIVFLEAMECGVPVICYDRGGQVDFLKNGETGFLVRLGDKKAFKDNLTELLSSPELRRNIAKFNVEYVQNFYIRNIAAKYLSVIEDVLSVYNKGRKITLEQT